MIEKIEMYSVSCDVCETILETDYSCWNHPEDAVEEAAEYGWHRDGDKHYCPDCHKFDDNDNVIIKLKEVTK
jgi:hypothetical protein